MPENLRAHIWTAAIFGGALLALWIVFAHPKVLLTLLLVVLGAVVYYVLFLLVKARLEGIDDGGDHSAL